MLADATPSESPESVESSPEAVQGPSAPATSGPDAAPSGPAPRRRGTARDLVWSLLAVVAVVGVLVVIVPRPQRVDQPPVDVVAAADSARPALGFDVAVPRGLPSGWLAREAEVREGQGKSIPTWRVTYLTPSQGWASVVQASEWTAQWEKREVSSGAPGEPRDIDGVRWVPRDLAERDRLTLVHHETGDPVTTIVTCTCPQTELLTLLRSLDPAPGR